MLGLAQVDTDGPVGPGQSILHLFHDIGAQPDDLTPWDTAYLRALYVSDDRRNAANQRGQMTQLMREFLDAGEE